MRRFEGRWLSYFGVGSAEPVSASRPPGSNSPTASASSVLCLAAANTIVLTDTIVQSSRLKDRSLIAAVYRGAGHTDAISPFKEEIDMRSSAMPVVYGQPVSLSTPDTATGPGHYELLYHSLFLPGRGYAFPCDARGHVDLDRLSDRARQNYLYAKDVAGSELSLPFIERQG